VSLEFWSFDSWAMVLPPHLVSSSSNRQNLPVGALIVEKKICCVDTMIKIWVQDPERMGL
jgi:hypothetical protein